MPQAELLKVDGFPTLYQGTPVKVSPGTYLIAGEVPTYSTGETLTSQTLVFRKIAIRKTGTIRLNGRDGKQLTVGLTGAQAQDQDLAAGACLANTAAGSGEVEQAAWGGDGVAVYAVPVRSAYVRFSYLSIHCKVSCRVSGITWCRQVRRAAAYRPDSATIIRALCGAWRR